jgi:hypothetical protein
MSVVVPVSQAAFDTRLEGRPVLTGQASKGIARLLRQHGFTLAAKPESFLVTKDSQLRDGEQARAWDWGRQLANNAAAAKLSAADRAD